MEGADVVTPGHTRPPGILYIRKNTQKSKFLLSQAFNWEKIMFFVIPEMPSKTYALKKLPDHFKGRAHQISNFWFAVSLVYCVPKRT